MSWIVLFHLYHSDAPIRQIPKADLLAWETEKHKAVFLENPFVAENTDTVSLCDSF